MCINPLCLPPALHSIKSIDAVSRMWLLNVSFVPRHHAHIITHLLHKLAVIFIIPPFWTVTDMSEQDVVGEMYSYIPSHTSMTR